MEETIENKQLVPVDDFLDRYAELLHGNRCNKYTKLLGGSSVWLRRETRINMHRILEFMHTEDLKHGQRKRYMQEYVLRNLKLGRHAGCHAIYMLCLLKPTPVRTYAWRVFCKRGLPKVKTIQQYRIIEPIRRAHYKNETISK